MRWLKSLFMLAALLLSFAAVAMASGNNEDQLVFPRGRLLTNPTFTGEAYRYDMIAQDEVLNFLETNSITFAPAARSGWHTHGGMIIIATGGVGYCQEMGKPAQILRRGDIVEIPAGTVHWHGAAPDSYFSQIVIYDSRYQEPEDKKFTARQVTDEEYNNLTAVECTTRQVNSTNLMFPPNEKDAASPMFSGPAYVSSLVPGENAAGATPIAFVAFAVGTYNNWHTHPGGQILIVTDGVGYHQLAGQPVEILHAGEVAICPPGETHWHGALPNTEFAHIAINTNLEKGKAVWHDRLPEDEYLALPKGE